MVFLLSKKVCLFEFLMTLMRGRGVYWNWLTQHQRSQDFHSFNCGTHLQTRQSSPRQPSHVPLHDEGAPRSRRRQRQWWHPTSSCFTVWCIATDPALVGLRWRLRRRPSWNGDFREERRLEWEPAGERTSIIIHWTMAIPHSFFAKCWPFRLDHVLIIKLRQGNIYTRDGL